PNDCNRPPVRPHAVRLLQVTPAVGSRNPAASPMSVVLDCPPRSRVRCNFTDAREHRVGRLVKTHPPPPSQAPAPPPLPPQPTRPWQPNWWGGVFSYAFNSQIVCIWRHAHGS